LPLILGLRSRIADPLGSALNGPTLDRAYSGTDLAGIAAVTDVAGVERVMVIQ